MVFFRFVTLIALLLTTVGNGLAEGQVDRKNGPCSLHLLSREDFEKNRDGSLLVSTGKRTKLDCFCAAEKPPESDKPHVGGYFGYGIQLDFRIVNRSPATVVAHWSIAFFDKGSNFLGGTGMAVPIEKTEGTMSYFADQKIYLPLGVLKRVASYRLTYYESENPGSAERPRLRTNKTSLSANRARHPQWHVLWTGEHESLAETITGDCLIGYGSYQQVLDDMAEKDVSKMVFDVRFEGKAKLVGGCSFWLDNFQRPYWVIDTCGCVANSTTVPMYFQYCAAFFDQSGDLVGCLDRMYFAGQSRMHVPGQKPFLLGAEGIKPGECGFADQGGPGGVDIHVPDRFYQTITSYQLTYYESAAPIGQQ